jgi:hypothetical protein
MIKVVDAFDKMNQKRAAAKKRLPPLYVAGPHPVSLQNVVVDNQSFRFV